MYLSRIQLTPAIAEQSQLGRILRDRSYGMHRLLWDLFESRERFLFREESAREQLGSHRNLPLYYVLSPCEPQRDHPFFRIECKPFAPRLQAGDRLSFRLRANPTVARKREGKKNSARHDVVMDAQYQWLQRACSERSLANSGTKSELRHRLLGHGDFNGTDGRQALQHGLDEEVAKASVQWLDRRGERNGFVIDAASIDASCYQWRALPEKGRGAGFSTIDYQGYLVVTDPAEFIAALARGVGPSKAFGCGLMLIRRA